MSYRKHCSAYHLPVTRAVSIPRSFVLAYDQHAPRALLSTFGHSMRYDDCRHVLDVRNNTLVARHDGVFIYSGRSVTGTSACRASWQQTLDLKPDPIASLALQTLNLKPDPTCAPKDTVLQDGKYVPVSMKKQKKGFISKAKDLGTVLLAAGALLGAKDAKAVNPGESGFAIGTNFWAIGCPVEQPNTLPQGVYANIHLFDPEQRYCGYPQKLDRHIR